MKLLNEYFERQSFRSIFLISLLLTVIIGILDHITGSEISSSLFYLPAIGVAAWYADHRAGNILSMIAAAVWMITDRTAGHYYSHELIFLWNGSVRLALFLIVSYLFASLRLRMKKIEELVFEDSLTGAVNSRAFYIRCEEEILRSARYTHPFSLVYMDLDNFKTVNDRFGNSTGDDLLRTVASVIKSVVRQTDVCARLGGDEFAILFPETAYEESGRAIEKIRNSLLNSINRADWPVTFSIGAVTFDVPPEEVQGAIKLADELMYMVKNSSKNNLIHARWDGTRLNYSDKMFSYQADILKS